MEEICCEGKNKGSALLCVCKRVLITSKGVMRKEVNTAPVTAATAFLVRVTGRRASPCPSLDDLRDMDGRSSDVTAIEGNASGSVMSRRDDEDIVVREEDAMRFSELFRVCRA